MEEHEQNLVRIVRRDGGELSPESQELQDQLDAIYGDFEYLYKDAKPRLEPDRGDFCTPKWLTKEQHLQIDRLHRKAYKLRKETGVSYDVDHMVPIRGKNVCGLNVPWNLRIITHAENRTKSNQLLPEFDGATYQA